MAGFLPVAWVHAGHAVGGAGLAGLLAVAVQQGNEALGGRRSDGEKNGPAGRGAGAAARLRRLRLPLPIGTTVPSPSLSALPPLPHVRGYAKG